MGRVGLPRRAGHVLRAGCVILGKVRADGSTKLHDVLADVYRDAIPDPIDITRFEWETIRRYLCASSEEIGAVQLKMGRVWQ